MSDDDDVDVDVDVDVEAAPAEPPSSARRDVIEERSKMSLAVESEKSLEEKK